MLVAALASIPDGRSWLPGTISVKVRCRHCAKVEGCRLADRRRFHRPDYGVRYGLAGGGDAPASRGHGLRQRMDRTGALAALAPFPLAILSLAGTRALHSAFVGGGYGARFVSGA
jgi:hypothetical protein